MYVILVGVAIDGVPEMFGKHGDVTALTMKDITILNFVYLEHDGQDVDSSRWNNSEEICQGLLFCLVSLVRAHD